MRRVVVAGIGQTVFGKFLHRTVRSLAEEALSSALADSGIEAEQIGVTYFANALSGLVTGQETIRGQVALRNTGVMGRPIINVDNACASGSTAFHLAWLAVASGQADVALAIGAEKLTHEDKSVTFGAFASGVDVEERARLQMDAPQGHSVFMDIYAERARRYMASSGATPEDFALVCIKSRQAASTNEWAQFRAPVTAEEVLGSRMISTPLTLNMCSPIADGAAAAILVSEAFAQRLAKPRVYVKASAIVSANQDGLGTTAAERAANAAYEAAGLGPEDIHVAEVHDASAPAEIMLYERLGFAAPGEGVALLRDGVTSVGGRLPVNPGGGLLSRGHPVGATGIAQLIELTTHLRGTAGARQREGARAALAECSGGQLGADSALAAATILTNF
ncbi:thiolase family protein [Paraburkholderia silviterrae]|uniref:propanoyl-CoA C-acyltransferase n=1 Tax=Paraburkholderia silviterrae TaxID=2528715 RepID=A0A4R5M3S5_9BURK|nr:thiolase family protein [Paraburkholderia silviterrae]TDG19957.1 thiolase family protein [Paraburkholderia silviterrae]